MYHTTAGTHSHTCTRMYSMCTWVKILYVYMGENSVCVLGGGGGGEEYHLAILYICMYMYIQLHVHVHNISELAM